MPYTLTFSLIDGGDYYTAGLPTLTGTITNPRLTGGNGAAFDATISAPPAFLTLAFTSPAVPPATACAVLTTDNTRSGGDWLRSGVLTALPASPATATIYTFPTVPITAATVAAAAAAAAIKPTIVPGWLRWVVGILTAGLYIPLVYVLPAPTVTLGAGTITATVAGFLAVRVFYFGVITTGIGITVTMTPAPSHDAEVPSRVLSTNITASSFASSLSVLAGLGTALATEVASTIESTVNSTIISLGHAAAAARGFQITSTAVFSARAITVTPTGISLQVVLCDLWGPALTPLPGTLSATIAPPPKEASPQSYTVTVVDSVTGAPVPMATVTLYNYDVNGNPSNMSATTNASGQAQFTVTLHSKKVTKFITSTSVGPDGKPDREPERVTTTLPPTLTVDAAGYTSIRLVLP